MAKLGSDWMYIGLGIGAIYLVYKLSKPVTDVGNQVSQLTGGVANLGSDILGDIRSGVDMVAHPFTLSPSSSDAGFVSASDFFFKSPLVTIPQEVKAITKAFTDNKVTKTSSNYANYSPVANPTDVRQKTIIASSQGLVSVAPPKASPVAGAKISPFTGAYYK